MTGLCVKDLLNKPQLHRICMTCHGYRCLRAVIKTRHSDTQTERRAYDQMVMTRALFISAFHSRTRTRANQPLSIRQNIRTSLSAKRWKMKCVSRCNWRVESIDRSSDWFKDSFTFFFFCRVWILLCQTFFFQKIYVFVPALKWSKKTVKHSCENPKKGIFVLRRLQIG